MLTAIVQLSLRYKLLVIVAFAIVVFLGMRAFEQVPVLPRICSSLKL